jgi:hypothetical protein
MSSGKSDGRAAPACGTCGTTYGDAAWTNLELVQRILPDEMARLILDWPAELLIEVRVCAGCSRPIAAKRPEAACTQG